MTDCLDKTSAVTWQWLWDNQYTQIRFVHSQERQQRAIKNLAVQ